MVGHYPSRWTTSAFSNVVPIVGNLFSIPPGLEYIAYVKLGKQLNSDIISLKLFGYDFVVLNSFRAAADMLDKRSSIYSDRLNTPMVQDPTDVWRSNRRMLSNWLNARAVTQFHAVQEQQVQPLLRRLVCLVNDPHPFEKVKHSIFINTASSMLKLAYGYTLQADDDPVFQDIHHTTKNVEVAGMFTTGNALRTGGGQLKERTLSVPYEWTKAQIQASGTAEPSILGALLQNPNLTSHLQEDEKERTIANEKQKMTCILAGTDTVSVLSIVEIQQLIGMKSAQTSTVLVAFVAAMVLNPDVQAKAQKELDSVIGPASLPTMSDHDRLPYIRNLIREVLRWQPAFQQPSLMRAGETITTKDMTSKKGQSCKLWSETQWTERNLQAMNHPASECLGDHTDENMYKDPEAFDPDRFQDPDVPYAPAFGWGRRLNAPDLFCGGIVVHYDSITPRYVYVLKEKRTGWARDHSKIENMSNALVMELKPFEFELKLRSPSHRQLILDCSVQVCMQYGVFATELAEDTKLILAHRPKLVPVPLVSSLFILSYTTYGEHNLLSAEPILLISPRLCASPPAQTSSTRIKSGLATHPARPVARPRRHPGSAYRLSGPHPHASAGPGHMWLGAGEESQRGLIRRGRRAHVTALVEISMDGHPTREPPSRLGVPVFPTGVANATPAAPSLHRVPS
ncbi:cytochrome P450 [Rhizoctonia solani]|uniref:Cytochrome P450 n=1 Tax=Rhizoctonia solani TaxID=456999 RepID=A0A8H7I3J1_9AGAM|nr:cytochrome P450 [Rhizoctonia solani]